MKPLSSTRETAWRLLFGAFAAAMVLVFSFSFAAAAGSYETSLVTMTGGGHLTMEPGERTTINAEFLNTGSATWYNDGDGYVSVYTHGPKYRKSVFDPATWLWGDHPARIREVSVAPGEVAHVSFELHAPQDTGYYEETFHLASEETAWVGNGQFTFKITVEESNDVATTPTASVTDGYGAELAVTSANEVKAKAGTPILFTAGFKNTGSVTWNNYSIVRPDVSIASNIGDFTHPSWSGSQVAYADSTVKPGEMAIASFAMRAPSYNGTHTARFQLQANGVDVPDAFVEIPVTVTGGSAAIIDAPVVVDDVQDATNYIEEPLMRIGILIVDEETDDEVVITSAESAFKLLDINGTVLAELPVNGSVTAYYYNGNYYYDVGNGTQSSTLPLRFVPEVDHAVMKIANFDRRLTRSSRYADNEFRGVFELQYNDYKDRTWLINELDLEYYLRGLAETSNVSPIEYQKALITAARTYAFYHYTHASKYKNEFFHISCYSWDQVYNGYGQETRAPKITQAAQDTTGHVVTYDGDLAITPYFSRSDGRTRDFSEVWNGSRAWLVSVEVPWDAGKTLWGHGVGMSASGALAMANEDYTWEEILKHFYTGIELTKKWQ